MKFKQLITSILLIGIINHYSAAEAGFFSSGSLESPVEISKNQFNLIKLKVDRLIYLDKPNKSEIEIEVHNDSNWNIVEIVIRIEPEIQPDSSGKESRKYSFSESSEIQDPKNETLKKIQKKPILKNQTKTLKVSSGSFGHKLKDGFIYEIVSIKGYED